MNASFLNTQGLNDVGHLCQDPESKGFDLQAGLSWIYPTNYSFRDYQYNIVQEALHKNTLVSLPTGLGKTFIAAVVMYNFYRWYPHDKVIFMAPTRPLVKQQMDACYNITAIPQEVTAELTGTKVQQSRTEIWEKKRVFFITPQVLQNDLAIIIELGGKIKCLVFDEAHRAKGNHAYCEVIRKLLPKNRLFRVLALSATPGNSSKDVIEVMQNLLIAHTEFRSEESPDVKPYVFERALETVVVPLGEKLQQVKEEYVQILEKYTRTLIQYKVIYGNCGNLTKGKIFMVMKDFQARNSGSRTPNYAEIMKSLNICVTLYHAYETLIRCGLRAFLNFYEEHINNPLLRGNISLRQILEDLKEYLGPSAQVQPLPDGTFVEIPASTKFGHPKFYKLRDILLAHFKNTDASTRVIVFFEYRESAAEAYTLLSQNHPTIRSRVFVGQGSGVTQKDQINTVKAFREGTCNTLLSTCIGEEGLDVGEVELIVCFDIANKSPIRMIQRMGRTGRKKEGRVVVLVTEGREQQTLKDCLIYKSNLGNFANNTEQLEQGKYRDNPTMIPSYIQPKCHKMFITVKKPVLAKSASLKDILKKMSSNGPKFIEDFEIVEITERITTKVENLWNKEHPLDFEFEKPKIDFTKNLEKQRAFQACGQIKPSKQSEIFVSLLQFADSKRFNIPVTQHISKFSDFSQNKILKQGDIRSMFSKPVNTLSQEILLNSQGYNFEKEKDITQAFPAELFDEISAFLSIQESVGKNCKTCDFLFECPKMMSHKTELINLSTWVQPDLSILDTITAKDLEVFADSLSPKSKDLDLLEIDNEIFEDVTFSEQTRKSLAYETPRNFDKILNSFRICENQNEDIIEEKSFAYETPKSFGKVLNLLGSVSEKIKNNEAISKKNETPSTSRNLEVIQEVSSKSKYEDVLLFFRLSSFDEVFAFRVQNDFVDLDKTIIYTPKVKRQKAPQTYNSGSPDLFPSSEKEQPTPDASESHSPIFCSFETVQKMKAKKKLFHQSKKEESEVAKKPKLANLKLQRKSFCQSPKNQKISSESRSKFFDISDVCDLANFGLADFKDKKEERKAETKREEIRADLHKDKKEEERAELKRDERLADLRKDKKENERAELKRNDLHKDKKEEEKAELKKQESIDLDISELCDLSIFGLGGPSVQTKQKEISKTVKESETEKPKPMKEKNELTVDDLCDLSDFFGDSFVDKNEQNKDTAKPAKISDVCDFSYFTDSPEKETQIKKDVVDLTDTPNKNTPKHVDNRKPSGSSTDEKKNKFVVIDLTDSDFESSPVKTQVANKTLSQLSITQMLSLVAKTNNSQKENSSTPKTKKASKPVLSLSNKKGVLQLKHVGSSNTQKKTPKENKHKFNISLAGDSDDEFEAVTFRSPIFPKPRPVGSDKKSKVEKPSSSMQRKGKKLFCEFVDEEAEVSEGASEDEDSGEDCFEASFIADQTQVLNTTNMQARYLQSVRSPMGRGKFKIPTKFKRNISSVYSQAVDNEDNSYINDSFCVNTEDVETCDNNMSELDLLEMKLKEMKKSKKRKKSGETISTKRRRIIVSNEDSD